MTARFLPQARKCLAQEVSYSHPSTPSMAFYGISSLLHHSLHKQSPTGSGSPRRARRFHSIWATCFRLPGLGGPLRDHARPHTSVCRFRNRIHLCIDVDEVPQKRDLEDPEKRRFLRPALAFSIAFPALK